ncbi:MAG: translation initiation factor IF-2 [Candidatus Portnoybacteria bacterium]|jgi:translation initiation factor IF-2|nr:translation initiation factor IF-2 [Candidatus Portnoybacteria bacterium]
MTPINTTAKIKKDRQPRPPVVVVLGHVDHGKTSILDFIKKTKVAEKESGGITQHIGAYQIEHQGKTITFLDTPGHEAFSAMRSRGAKVADMAVLVVAADDGVKPQTKEAIKHILRLDLPIIVALNKMDKPTALPDKVKKELSDNGIVVEPMGGKIPLVFTSAKTGLGIDELLEMILLVAEMENFEMKKEGSANGVIIESRLDAQKGTVATLLVKEGTLKTKDSIAAESAYGTVKSMENFLGQPLEQAPPSTPVLITGFTAVPPVGEEWSVLASPEEARAKTLAKAASEKPKREMAEILEIGPDQKVFNLILKADVSGSLEAIYETLKSIPQDEIILRVLKAEAGEINESDVKLAEAARAKIYGFRTKTQSMAEKLAERKKIKIRTSPIIYELVQQIRQDAGALLRPETNRERVGRLRVLAVFKTEGRKQIIGGRVTDGQATRNAIVSVSRDEEILGQGKILQLQQNKQSIATVGKDKECGLQIESEIAVEKNDILELYREEKIKREL